VLCCCLAAEKTFNFVERRALAATPRSTTATQRSRPALAHVFSPAFSVFLLLLRAAMAAETLLATISSSRGAACAAAVERAAAAPAFFSFAAVLALPSVRELGPSHPAVALARLLAHGSLEDARAAPAGALPASFAPGSPAWRKAQAVTLQAAALRARELPYDALLAATGAGGDAELEALVRDAVYAGLLDGRLDARGRRLVVAHAAGRELPPGDAPALAALAADLKRWRAGIAGALDAVAATADAVAAGARAEGAWAADVGRAIDAAAAAAARAAAAKQAAADERSAHGGGHGGARGLGAYGFGEDEGDDDGEGGDGGGGGGGMDDDSPAGARGAARGGGARAAAGGGGARAPKRRAGPAGGVVAAGAAAPSAPGGR